MSQSLGCLDVVSHFQILGGSGKAIIQVGTCKSQAFIQVGTCKSQAFIQVGTGKSQAFVANEPIFAMFLPQLS